jgi:hypothetical protein
MNKSRNTKKRSNKTKKLKRTYSGGDVNINPEVKLNETDQSTHSLYGFANNVISGTENFVAKTANEAASNIVESAEKAAEGALTTAIHTLNNPELEAEAVNAIKTSGHIATEIVQAANEPIKEGIADTIETMEESAKKAGPAMVRAGIDTVEAVPVLGTVILLADEVNQLAKVAVAGSNVFTKAFQTFANVSSKVMDVVTKTTNIQSPIGVQKQMGGMIKERNEIIKRVDKSISKFESPIINTHTRKYNIQKKHNKIIKTKKRVRFNI